jgi:hypothetical protein
MNPRFFLLLVFALSFSAQSKAQTNESSRTNPAPNSVPVTLFMDWTRGDTHYGSNFIQLRAPCQAPPEKSCECVADFKVIASKENSAEFANYVTSFEHGKVPLTYQVTYNTAGRFLGSQLLSLGSWTRDRFHSSDGLLSVRVTLRADPRGQVQASRIHSPSECFPPINP